MTPEKLREEAKPHICPKCGAACHTVKETIAHCMLGPQMACLNHLKSAHAAALEEIERLNAAWKAQQFHLEAEERESAHWQERAEKAERRAERLKGHAEAMAPVGMLEPLRIIGDRLLAHYGDRFCLTRPTLHTDNERQVLVAALKALRAGLAYRADKGE